MRSYSMRAGEGDLSVTLDVTSTDGQGIACFLHGGTMPHVGGQALASPGVILHGAQLSRCDLWVSTVPGHKDADAAAAVARRLCLATGEAVSVVAGIHVDGADERQIEALMAACVAACDEFVRVYQG